MSENRKIIIGTRRSKLAMAQANYIQHTLTEKNPGIVFELKEIVTQGDRIQDVPLDQMGGIGVFTKEIETALLEKEIDLAVHSAKDLPANMPEGLVIMAVPEREAVEDVFIGKNVFLFKDLPQGARIGTSSQRRKAQLLALRPDLDIVSLRGNLDTRLRKLKDEELDGIILAQAGLKRLGMTDVRYEVLSAYSFLPAIGQGALGIQGRTSDDYVMNIVKSINHQESFCRLQAERALLETMQGGCSVPIAALTEIKDDRITMIGRVLSPDGIETISEKITGNIADSINIGQQMAKKLKEYGADRILASYRR